MIKRLKGIIDTPKFETDLNQMGWDLPQYNDKRAVLHASTVARRVRQQLYDQDLF